VVRTENERVLFFECDYGLTGGSAALSHCQSIGQESGYAAADIDARGRKLRTLKWAKNLVMIPAGAACGAILAGYIGMYQMVQAITGANQHALDAGGGFMELEILLPLELILIPVAGAAYGLFGAIGGFVASYGFSFYTMPNLKKGSQAMLFASRKADVPSLIIKGKIENYHEALVRALAGIPATQP
jgi:hypothetical protein